MKGSRTDARILLTRLPGPIYQVSHRETGRFLGSVYRTGKRWTARQALYREGRYFGSRELPETFINRREASSELWERRDRKACHPKAYDEFKSHDPESRAGILHIRSLRDAELLTAAHDSDSESFDLLFKALGPDTNRSWITSQCAIEAYMRGVMSPDEMDRICE